jgi:GrpB-like predicted nucleotidyltransferase (UPF0157 family)
MLTCVRLTDRTPLTPCVDGRLLSRLDKSGLRRVADQVRLSEHRVFNEPDTDINLRVFSSGCPEIDRMLMFRDWLRANAADRDLYTRTKLAFGPEGLEVSPELRRCQDRRH